MTRCDYCGFAFETQAALSSHEEYVLEHPNEDGTPLCATRKDDR
jgi:hypothetical protein